jgi:hypothetical protein
MIPDNEYNALKKWAWKRGMTFSAIITDLLRQNVPTIELVNRGKKSASSTDPAGEPGPGDRASGSE